VFVKRVAHIGLVKTMNKVKLSKFLSNNLSTASCYLTKMEILLIFVLSITSGYAVKMEMLLAETKPISPTETLIGKAVIQPNRGIVKQSTMMFEKNLLEVEHKNIQGFIARAETEDQNYEKDTAGVLDKGHIFYGYDNIAQKDAQIDIGGIF